MQRLRCDGQGPHFNPVSQNRVFMVEQVRISGVQHPCLWGTKILAQLSAWTSVTPAQKQFLLVLLHKVGTFQQNVCNNCGSTLRSQVLGSSDQNAGSTLVLYTGLWGLILDPQNKDLDLRLDWIPKAIIQILTGSIRFCFDSQWETFPSTFSRNNITKTRVAKLSRQVLPENKLQSWPMVRQCHFLCFDGRNLQARSFVLAVGIMNTRILWEIGDRY